MNSQADLFSMVELHGHSCTWIKGKAIFNNLRGFLTTKAFSLGQETLFVCRV